MKRNSENKWERGKEEQQEQGNILSDAKFACLVFPHFTSVYPIDDEEEEEEKEKVDKMRGNESDDVQVMRTSERPKSSSFCMQDFLTSTKDGSACSEGRFDKVYCD